MDPASKGALLNIHYYYYYVLFLMIIIIEEKPEFYTAVEWLADYFKI